MLPQVDRPGTLEKVITALQAVLKLLGPFESPEKWKGLAYQPGWQDYADVSFERGQFRKSPLGRVELRGIVARTAGVTVAVAILPVGYRPAKGKLLTNFANGGTANYVVRASGLIEYVSGGVAYISLDGITFDTEA